MAIASKGQSQRFEGVIPPLITPFDQQRNVDAVSLQRLVDYQIEAGVDGLFILGSSGEFCSLTMDQRDTVISTVQNTVRGRVPVLAGIAAPGTAIAMEYMRQAASYGIKHFVVTPPYYYLHTQREVCDHFRILREQSHAPLIAYTVPLLVKVPLYVDTLISLAGEGTICAVKDSSGDMQAFRRLLIAAENLPGFSVMSGMELLVDTVLHAGAAGVVPGLANVAPQEYAALYRLCREERWDEARHLQNRMIRLFDICSTPDQEKSHSARALSAFKAALKWLRVLDTSHMAPPFEGLGLVEERHVRDILLEVGLLTSVKQGKGERP